MSEPLAAVRPLTSILDRAGRELPPEQAASLSKKRYCCEKTTALVIAILTCLTLLTVALVKVEHLQEVLFNPASNDSLLVKILARLESSTAVS